MVVIRQGSDRLGVYSPGSPGSQSEEESQARGRRSSSRAGCASEGDFIERLWETEGVCAVERAFNEKERKRKREAGEGAAHGLDQFHLRHDGHFAAGPARPKLKGHDLKKEALHQGEQQEAEPQRAWCGDSVAKETSIAVTDADVDGDGDGDLQEEYCGLQCFESKEGATVARSHAPGQGSPPQQTECFNSSFDLLKIEPREHSLIPLVICKM